MNFPRIVGAVLCLWFGLKFWGRKNFGFHSSSLLAALIAGAICVGDIFSRTLYPIQCKILLNIGLVIFIGSSLCVALFEELLFRGGLLQSLKERHGNFIAIWISSFLFTIFHIQAQEFHGWPFIFMSGLFWAGLRIYQRVSLVWLIVIHWVVDVVWIFRQTPEYFMGYSLYSLRVLAWVVVLGAYYLWVWRRRAIS